MTSSNPRLFVLAGLLLGAALVVFLSPLASGSPDGLEKVAEEQGFDDAATESEVADGPLADYSVDGVDGDRSTVVSGLIGILVTFGIGTGAFAALRAFRPHDVPDDVRH